MSGTSRMAPKHFGPRTQAADQLHAMKYREKGEDFREAMNRVAMALKDDDVHYHRLREILLAQRFVPAGRIQAAMGATKKVTAYNCYVSGTIDDAYVNGSGSIMGRAHQAAATMRMGGGIGYDFSTLRPRGFRVAQIDSQASGPVSFMPIFDAVCQATSSYGHRRGAQMGVLRVDHPDIVEFVNAKQNETDLRGFNVSVAVTNEFMEAALAEKTFELRFGRDFKKEIDAAQLWEKIMRSTWDWAEPGVLFIDTINRMNNLYYCETIAATNPCGEQPLPPYGACLLGSFNLAAYVTNDERGNYSFDLAQLCEDIPHVVAAMDNVVDRTFYPLAEQKAEAVTKRRMGLGVLGAANAIEATGFPYGSHLFNQALQGVLEIIRNEAYRASALRARTHGAFPLFDVERYMSGQFIKALPDEVKALIKTFGIRNSHLTSIAPTGTISMTCDNASSGIEPVFSYETQRPINTPDGQVMTTLHDLGVEKFGSYGRLADEITIEEHASVLVAAQQAVDSAVSKTCNYDGTKIAWDDFKNIYRYVWEHGGKGCTTFNSAGLRMALLQKKAPEHTTTGNTMVGNSTTEVLIGNTAVLVDKELVDALEDRVTESCEFDPVTGRRSCE